MTHTTDPNYISHATHRDEETESKRSSTETPDFGQGPITRRQVAKHGTISSEGGHELHKIKPMAKHSGKSVVVFFNGLFQTIIAISTLGTSITFSFVLSGNTQLASPTAYYSQERVILFLAVSWLLFLLALAFSALGSTLLTFFRAHWERDWDGQHGKKSQLEVQLYAVLISALLGGMIIGAFIFLALVIVAYCAPVGWTALGFIGLFGLIIVGCVLYQMPWPWRDNTPRSPTKGP